MIVLAGASASGKTEVAKFLAKKYGITKIVTTTTREKRKNEVDGVDYFFVSKERFLEMIKEGRFVEFTSYNGNYYGSTKDQIVKDKCVVIDPEGLRSYIALNDPSIMTFFLEATEQTRHDRMIFRGDDFDKIESRIANDRVAFRKENIATVDYIIDSNAPHSVEEVTDTIYRLYMKK